MAQDVLTGVPALAFAAFLALRARPALQKLRTSQSLLMKVLFVALVSCSTLSLIRVVATIAGSSNTAAWNSVWILDQAGMLFLEVSMVLFLIHGHLASGAEALARAVIVSVVLALLDAGVKAGMVFGANVPLFAASITTAHETDPDTWTTRDAHDSRLSTAPSLWPKWGFWLVHCVLLSCFYAALLLAPYTALRALVPAKRSFAYYVAALLAIHGVGAVGALLSGMTVGVGLCAWGLASAAYGGTYPWLLYMTLLQDFLASQSPLDLSTDLIYYSEMRDAGCFDEG
eukprot:CAMPEP_0202913958 /NCGR_PEP_ID=MMETSP1392-20130828/61897_1 /ASSEMBLY_ACC=CAM_ASM_000868 /TAXON_ID=225041 /ORGANISM="Chlamydomonas chlamydogama, Strain SAG 11-48b" /LENGTH=285 /DNA_ID=CAMNT_0049605427 /DNA_START=111 /DNA_END=969 /DNA_ORIENTATION=+